MTKAIAAASRADFIKTSLRIRNSTGWDSSVKATLSTRGANQAESFPAYSNEITVGKVRLPSACDRIAITTPQTPSHFLRASRARKFGRGRGRGRGNRTPGGPCERTPVFRTGDFANSSTPLHDLAETAGLEPVRFAQGRPGAREEIRTPTPKGGGV